MVLVFDLDFDFFEGVFATVVTFLASGFESFTELAFCFDSTLILVFEGVLGFDLDFDCDFLADIFVSAVTFVALVSFLGAF